ncbi:hypothetical protein Golomagni_06159 [Golovinomyces magnicellulatus]|nr:hypothetical protein Golomagni_06159 [Golovinomyces magnicellulatus]
MASQNGSGSESKGADLASVTEYHSDQDQKDHHQLATLGKKGVLKRTFHFISILGFSCTVLVTWEGATILFAQGLTNGGPIGTIISFIFVWFGNLSVFAALSELVSMAPTSGGQYHWVSMLAPKWASKILSYVTGWLTIGGWLGSMAAGCFLTGTMLQGIINLTHPSYVGTGWQGSLFMFLAALISTFVNSMANTLLPKFEALALVVHVAGFFAILIPVVYLAPHNDTAFVFETFSNLGQFPTDGLAFFLGMMGNVVAFVGADAAFHMCEEVQNPSVVVPQSIMAAVIINGAVGLAMMIAMLYCINDIEKTLATTTGFPFMEIFRNATGSRAAAAGMTVVMIVMAMTATIGIHASVSRIVWAFSRDKALPGWKAWSKVSLEDAS